MSLGHEPMSEMWSRRVRWARTVRAVRPAGAAGALITHGIPLAILFALVSHGGGIGWSVLGLAIALRTLSVAAIAGRYTRDRSVLRLLPLLPVSDLVSFAIWFVSMAGSKVTWRGAHMRVEGGRLGGT